MEGIWVKEGSHASFNGKFPTLRVAFPVSRERKQESKEGMREAR
jgi:hypothetical protein